jgi:hypothetical protein
MNNKISKYNNCPNENLLARFVDGTLTGEDLQYVKTHIESCSDCNEMVVLAMEMNASFDGEYSEMPQPEIVPAFAAQADRKLCVLYAEQYILQQLDISVSMEELLTIAKENKWIKHQGVQFKNIGKLLEYHSFQVERKTDASLADLQKALEKGNLVIVGVDSGELFAHTRLKRIAEKIEDWFDKHADHVLLVKSLHLTNDTHDTAELINIDGEGERNFNVPVSKFLDAWEDSGRFMLEVKRLVD